MSMRLTSAIVLGLAIVAGPMSATTVLAAGQATAVSLQPVIRAAAVKVATTKHTVTRNGVAVEVSFREMSDAEKKSGTILSCRA